MSYKKTIHYDCYTSDIQNMKTIESIAYALRSLNIVTYNLMGMTYGMSANTEFKELLNKQCNADNKVYINIVKEKLHDNSTAFYRFEATKNDIINETLEYAYSIDMLKNISNLYKNLDRLRPIEKAYTDMNLKNLFVNFNKDCIQIEKVFRKGLNSIKGLWNSNNSKKFVAVVNLFYKEMFNVTQNTFNTIKKIKESVDEKAKIENHSLSQNI